MQARPVYRALHKPLLTMYVDRRLWWGSLLVGVVASRALYSLTAGLLLFALCYGLSLLVSRRDPQFITIVLRGLPKARYDGVKR